MVSGAGEPDDVDIFESIGSIVSAMLAQIQCRQLSKCSRTDDRESGIEDKESHAGEAS